VDSGRVALFFSPQIVAEVTEVLGRSKLQQKFATLTPESVQAFVGDLASKAVFLADVPAIFSYPRDPKDEPYLNLALASGAGYLVTWDKDLLDLMNETSLEGKAFRQRFPALTILDPVRFLQEIRRYEQPAQP
jgi:putative PIN family toxin of toxin-antitoxin system